MARIKKHWFIDHCCDRDVRRYYYYGENKKKNVRIVVCGRFLPEAEFDDGESDETEVKQFDTIKEALAYCEKWLEE